MFTQFVQLAVDEEKPWKEKERHGEDLLVHFGPIALLCVGLMLCQVLWHLHQGCSLQWCTIEAKSPTHHGICNDFTVLWLRICYHYLPFFIAPNAFPAHSIQCSRNLFAAMIVCHCVNSAMNTIETWSIPRPPGTDVIGIIKHNHKGENGM